MDSIYIFGHKKPDTDSICSAIAYAHLKNTQNDATYVPARLGDINRETRFVLDTFDVPDPEFIPHVFLRVADVMNTEIISAPATCTILDVGRLMREHRVRAVPIIDESRRVQGVITENILARNYLKELHVQGLADTPTELGRITRTLNGRLLAGEPAKRVSGKVVIGAMAPDAMVKYIAPGDLVAVGNRENAQEAALNCDISCLIITGDFDPSPEIQQLACDKGSAIIVTPHDTFAAARLINLSISVLQMVGTNFITVTPDTLVKEITTEVVGTNTTFALVNDADGVLVGMVTRSNLVTRRPRRVILVDHSERSQSAEGIEKAEIVEILDHHRLGGLETAQPMLAMIAPVGCTSTLVLRRYKELGVTPPRAMAGLMVAAILSDTMLLKSPTTTPEDVAAIDDLGKILGEDPLAFGRRMYNAKFDIETLSPDVLVTSDLKVFSLGSKTVGIGQVEVADKEVVLSRKTEILKAMHQYQTVHHFDLLLLMVSDILLEGTELIAVGQTRTVEKAFGVSLKEQSAFLPGVLSRKKQIVPPISNAL
ncbi:MAG: putative manganese-dependent inorganic diphosphatase [Anaerolineaceae bacterium]|nr:putative manganese-dependent inorganic diphosphatase [Anaerolineaceae bacterium]MCB9102092.1 putative manganese-dependent inorganic diphosphatase [Anaerolineales bacterium]